MAIPALPTIFTTAYQTSFAATRTVPGHFSSIQSAIDWAITQDGNYNYRILVDPSITTSTPLTLKAKTGANQNGTGIIQIETASYNSLPAPGTRVTPSYAGYMPTLIAMAAYNTALEARAAAHHYRFVGFRFRADTTAPTFALVVLGINPDTGYGYGVAEDYPDYITFDRCYGYGLTNGQLKHAFIIGGRHIEVVDCDIRNIVKDQDDNQAIVAWTGAGPYRVVNNFLSARTENVMFGGDNAIGEQDPADLEFRRNYVYKDPAWEGNGNVKNLLEFKNMRRALVEGNVFENTWGGGQSTAIVMTPRNETGEDPTASVQDITFRYNKLINVCGGFNNPGGSYQSPPVVVERAKNIYIYNNLQQGGQGGYPFFRIRNDGNDPYVYGVDDLRIYHNTFLDAGSSLISLSAAGGWTKALAVKLIFTDNIVDQGVYGVWGEGISPNAYDCTAVLNGLCNTWNWDRNAVLNATEYFINWPNTNWTETTTGIGFVNYPDDCTLAPSSPYKAGNARQASDGTDLGCNISALNEAIEGVVEGVPAEPGTVVGHGAGAFRPLRGSGTGYQRTQGVGAGTFKALRGSGTGTVSSAQIDSYGAGTFKPLQGAGTGELINPITSYGIAYLKPLTGAGSGTVGVTSTGAGTLKHLTGTGTGNVGVSGTGAGTVKHLTGAGTGTVGVTGTGAGTFQALRGDGTGLIPTINPTGSGAGTFRHLTGAGTGTVGRIQHIPPGKAKHRITGSGHGTFRHLLGAGEGLVTFPAIDGAGAATFKALAGAGEGAVSAAAIDSTGAGTLQALTGSGDGVVSLPAIEGVGAGTFRALTGEGTGGLVPEDITSAGAGTFAALTGQGTGYVNIPHPVVSGAMFAVEWYEIAGFLLPFYVCAKARSSGPVTPELHRGHPIMADPCPQECSVA